MVRRWHFLICLLALPGCQTIAEIDRADIIAELAVRYGAMSVRKPAPLPDDKTGCDEGCQCNGTGEERSGDGLAVVNCRCDDDCECKQAKEQPVAEEPVAVEPDPLPLVEIPQVVTSGSCTDGSCLPQTVRTYRTTRRRLFRR